MIDIIQGSTFRRWIHRLRDRRAVARINARPRNASLGHLGDTRSVGGGIFKMRTHYGPGYRLHHIRDGQTVIVLLCGGDKDSQTGDIERARHLMQEWR